MAASVSYRINGKYDGKAVTQAKSGMSQLTSSAKSLQGVLKGIGAGVSVAALVSQFKECTKTFKENNTAQAQMFQALSSNTKIAKNSVRGLVEEFDKMSGVFGGSDLVKGGSLLARMGLSEDEMRKTAKVAKDLAASGLMPLNQAFDVLGKSYTGNIASLKKMFPELAKFTDAQLKAGKAVEYLGEKFKGMEDALGNTFEGQITIIKDKIDGIKNSIGTIGGFLFQQNFKDLTDIIDKVSNLADSVLPTIAAWASTIIHTFANFDLMNIFSPKTLAEEWKSFYLNIAENFLMTFKWLKAKLGEGVNKAKLASDKNFLEDLQFRYDKMNAQRNANLQRYQKDFLTEEERQGFNVLTDLIAELKETIADREFQLSIKSQGLGGLLKDLWGANSDLYKKSLGFVGGFDAEAYYQQQLEAFMGYKATGGNPMPVVMTDENGNALPLSVTSGEGGGFSVQTKNGFDKGGFLSYFGELGEVIAMGFDSSATGILLKGASTFISELANKAPAFGKMLNVVTEAATRLVSPELVKLVNALSGPVMNGIMALVNSVVTQMAPMLELLTPVFWVIGKVVDGIGRTIETIAAVLYNIYAAVWNIAHSGKKNDLQYKSIKEIWADYNDWGDYVAPSAGSLSYDAVSASNAASYSAQRDIYVTITYNHSFVNGDAREIAVQLRNEILSAERLGY